MVTPRVVQEKIQISVTIKGKKHAPL